MMFTRNEGLEYGNYSGVGRVREKNEDYYGYFDTDKGHLFVVCDGMGGHKGGQIASRMAVETIKEYISSSMELEPKVFLRRAIEEANRNIYSEAASNPDLEGMGTTCVLLLIRPGSEPVAWIAHVGDSRIYRVRNGQIDRLTKDHSKVQKMIDMGILNEKEAAEHPEKNIITQAVGIDEEVYPDIKQIQVYRGDRYILCTDGITDLIDDREIEKHSGRKISQELAEGLVALSNERGGFDNATIQVVDVTRGKHAPKIQGSVHSSPRVRNIIIAAAAILAVVASFFLFDKGDDDDRTAGVIDSLTQGTDSLNTDSMSNIQLDSLNTESSSITITDSIDGMPQVQEELRDTLEMDDDSSRYDILELTDSNEVDEIIPIMDADNTNSSESTDQ